MKRTIALLLALCSLLLPFSGAFAEQDGAGGVVGLLHISNQVPKEFKEKLEGAAMEERIPAFQFFDNMASLLMALNAGRIDRASMPACVAEYVAARSEALRVTVNPMKVEFQIGVRADDAALLDGMNAAIARLIEDGTLDALKAQYIDALTPGTDPAPAQIPAIESADTVRVVVTGDLPPFDYVSADGKAAGFNVAFLAALGEAMNVNVELVLADAASRSAMLASGRADAIFWVRGLSKTDPNGKLIFGALEATDEIAVTAPYFSDDNAMLSRS